MLAEAHLSQGRPLGSDGACLESVSGFSHDPIAADVNLYRYCADDPLTHTDPTGLKTCGPDVTDWFVQEINLFLSEADKLRKTLDQMHMHSGDIDPWTAELVNIWKYARWMDYKTPKWNFTSPDCPKAQPGTVSLCGHCIQVNQLGNLMFGIFMTRLDDVELGRDYGRGQLTLPPFVNGPSEPWTKAPWKETAYDIGVWIGDNCEGKKSIDAKTFCELFNEGRNDDEDDPIRRPPIEHGCEGIKPCNAKYNGPHSTFTGEPGTDSSGNTRERAL
jgi:hypothetical protein